MHKPYIEMHRMGIEWFQSDANHQVSQKKLFTEGAEN